MTDPEPRRVLAHSRLRIASAGLAAASAAVAVHDLRRRRNPLYGPALRLGLAAGWCAVHHELAPRPYLSYTRRMRKEADSAITVPDSGLWCVGVTNAGDAAARIVAVSYFAEPHGGTAVAGDALEIRPVFDALGVVDERDYSIMRLTHGSALAPGARQTLYELPLPVAQKFSRLGVTLTYAGPFGERREVTADAIPPHGLPPIHKRASEIHDQLS